MSRRKRVSKEFKLDAVSLVLDQGYSRAEAARSLGLNSNMLGRWVSEHRVDGGQSFRGNDKLTPEQEEIRKLRSQVKNLKVARKHGLLALETLLNPKREFYIAIRSYGPKETQSVFAALFA